MTHQGCTRSLLNPLHTRARPWDKLTSSLSCELKQEDSYSMGAGKNEKPAICGAHQALPGEACTILNFPILLHYRNNLQASPTINSGRCRFTDCRCSNNLFEYPSHMGARGKRPKASDGFAARRTSFVHGILADILSCVKEVAH